MALRPEIRVDVYSHNLKVSKYSQRGREAMLDFCKGLVEYGLKMIGPRKFIREMVRVYAAATKDRNEFRVHRNQLDELLEHLKNWNYTEDQIELVHHPLYKPVPVTFNMDKDFVARDYQTKPIDYLINEDERIKILVVQTGRGKTAMSLAALARIKYRVALVIKGMYVEKWVSDVREMYGLKPGEVMVVRGSKDLINIIELAKAGELDAKFIIITNKTLYNFFKAYEAGNLKKAGYGCRPEDLFKVLGVGVRQIDEVHQDFHLNFRIDLYTHVPKTISLSATMDSDDKFINRMYELMFPPNIRFSGIAYDKYISVKALFYRAEDIRKLRYLGRRRSYSHVMFEQSIIKQKRVLKKYLALITDVIKIGYLKKREKGQKMLVFCATVEMCTIVKEHLQVVLAEEKLDIRRYVSEDEYENLLEPDIIVSTIKSAGTAVDVPHLRVCLLTDALFSRQANEQTVGRLRRLKDWPDVTPEFLYLVCEDIPQHIRYHQHKENVLSDKVLGHKTFNLGTRL